MSSSTNSLQTFSFMPKEYSTNYINDIIEKFRHTIMAGSKNEADDIVIDMMNECFIIHSLARSRDSQVYALMYDSIREASLFQCIPSRNIFQTFSIMVPKCLIKLPKKGKEVPPIEETMFYNLFNVWLNAGEKKKSVDEFVFDSRLDQGIVVQNRRIVLNTWPGFHLDGVFETLSDEDKEISEQAYNYFMKQFIFKIICKKSKSKMCYLLNWISCIIQRPYEKTGKNIILIGPQGSGKTFLMERLIKLFGDLGVLCPKSSPITDKFSGHLLQDRILACIDEARFSDDAAMDSLKSLTTNNVSLIDQKFVQPALKKNSLNFMLSSNDIDCVHCKTGGVERRFVFFDVDGRRKSDRDFFSLMEKQCDIALPFFFYAMKTMESSSFSELENIPESHILEELKSANMNSVDRFFHSCVVEEQTLPVSYDDSEKKYKPNEKDVVDPEKLSWRIEVNMKALYDKYFYFNSKDAVPKSLFLAGLKGIIKKYSKFEESNTEQSESWVFPYYKTALEIDCEMLGKAIKRKLTLKPKKPGDIEPAKKSKTINSYFK